MNPVKEGGFIQVKSQILVTAVLATGLAKIVADYLFCASMEFARVVNVALNSA